MWFLAGVRTRARACVCVFSISYSSNRCNSWTAWDIELEFITPMPKLEFYGISNCLKNVCGSSNFRKIWNIIRKLHTNIIYRSRTYGIEFRQNRLKRWNFWRFCIFWKLALNCLTCVHFELSSSNFVRERTNSK